jgi:cytoskeletal protein CcmA (bactofilin family)
MPQPAGTKVEARKVLKARLGLVAKNLLAAFLRGSLGPYARAQEGSSNMKFRSKQSDRICAFLDKGMTMTGELEATGTLHIDGNFQGSISSAHHLIVGEHAVVHADVKVGEAEIYGQFFGNIQAKNRVEIYPSGRVRADIHTPVLCVNPGAILDGGIRMADEKPDDASTSTGTVAEQPNTR